MARRRKLNSIRIEETAEGRFVVSTFDGGEVSRAPIAMNLKPSRSPRRPFQRAKVPEKLGQ